MKKTKSNIKFNKLSPSVEGSRNFKEILQLLDAKNFSEKTETPFVLIVCNQFLNILDFDAIINESIKWDHDQWKVPPSKLARSIILTPFLRVDKRCPLYRIEDGFEGMDLNLLFESNYLLDDFNDDHLGKLLDRINEVESTDLFSRIAFNAYTNFKIPISHTLHGDTTSHILYGQFEACEQEGYEGLNVTYGHSKDNHPELKQVMTGMLTDEYGIPIYEQTLDGNTSDSTWIKSAIHYLQGLLGDESGDYTFIADSKLVNKNNLEVIYADESPIKFISSCPSSFSSKIAEKTRKEAYLLDDWEDIGICCENEKSKRAARYKAQSFVKPVHGNILRLIVIKGNDPENKVIKNIEKIRKTIEVDIKKSFNKPFACKPDAQKAIDEFLKKHKNSLFDIKLEIDKLITEKNQVGRPSKNKEQSVIIEKFGVKLNNLTENKERVKEYRDNSESFVLITNIPENEKNNKEILQDYKKQKVIETNFEELKKPLMVSTIFLKKPGRIEALMMLLHISLLIRVLMRVIARMNLNKEKEPPRIDFSGRPLVNPTADTLLGLFALHSVVTVRNEYTVYSKSGKVDHLHKLLELLGLHSESG
jgi:transposase